MSKNLFLSLGGELSDLRTLPETKAQTASGLCLNVMGEVKKAWTIKVADFDFPVYPIIINDLNMPFNLGLEFLERHGWDILHSQGVVKIKERTVPLHKMRNGQVVPEEPIAVTYLARIMEIQAGHTSQAVLLVPAVRKGRLPAGDGLLTCHKKFGTNHLSLDPEAVTRVDQEGFLSVIVYNTGEEDATIQAGTLFGMFTHLTVLENQDAEPPGWYIGSIQLVDDKWLREERASCKGTATEDMLTPVLNREGHQSEEAAITQEAAASWTDQRKRDWINKQFQLNDNKLLKSAAQQEKLRELLFK